MANESIRQLADVLGMATARLSGDPQRMQMALGLQQSRKLQQQENKLNDWIGENIPEDQQQLLYALPFAERAKILMGSQTDKSTFERFTVYDISTGKPLRTINKAQASSINPQTEIIGPLADPRSGAKDNGIDTWAVTNSEGIRVKDLINPTKEELDEVVKQGNFINKTPVLSTAGKGLDKGLGEIRGWNDDGGLLERAMAYKGLVRSGNRIVQNLYNNPASVLAIGDISQVFDQIGEELTSIGGIINPQARNAFINKSPEGQDNQRIRQQFEELANQTALSESQLLDFAYQIAKVRGQEGRGLSDQDFRNFQKIISAGRTADQKAAALTNFIQGIKIEVQGALEDERAYRNATLARDKDNKQANEVVMGIQDVFSTGFGDVINPFAQQSSGTTPEDPLGIRQ
jgi:hypothetical protein